MGLFKLRKQNSETANEVADVDEWLKALDADVDTALAGAAPGAAASAHDAVSNVEVAATLVAPNAQDAPMEPPTSDSTTEVSDAHSGDAHSGDSVWHLPDLGSELPTTTGTAAFDSQESYKLPPDVSGTTVDPSDFAGATFDPTSLQLESLGSTDANPIAAGQPATVKPFETEPAAGFAILHSADDLPSRGTTPTAEFGIPDDIPLWGHAEPSDGGNLVSPTTSDPTASDPTMPAQPVATESVFSGVFDDAHRSVEALRPEPDASPVAVSPEDDHEVLPQPSYDLADFGVVLDSSPESSAGPTFEDVDCSTSDSSIEVPEGAEAATCLAILGLDRNVTWAEVKTAHGALISDHLAAGESDPARAQLARSIRREINTAYVSLRIMNGPDKI